MGRKPGLPILYLPLTSQNYWCRFTVRGARHRVTTGARDLGAAREEADRIYARATLGNGTPPRRVLRSTATAAGPLKLLVADYLVWTRANGKAASYVVKQEMHFRAHFLPRWSKLEQVTSPAIERYKVERYDVNLRTLYKELVTLSRFLRWCKKQGHLTEVPDFDRIRPVSDYQPLDMTAAHVAALLRKLPDRSTHHNRRAVREFFTVQWAQAMRPGEVMTLRWQDVDLDKRRITISMANDKARVGRTIGMAVEAHAILTDLAKMPHLPTAWIFGRCTYRASLRLAARAAKIPGHERITPHHLRHARLSQLASTTHDVAAVQFFAGHKNLATTDRYVRSRTERTEEMLRGVDSGILEAGVSKKREKRRAAG